MDRRARAHLGRWLELRTGQPAGRLLCSVRGPTRGRPYASAGIRAQLHHTAAIAGVRRVAELAGRGMKNAIVDEAGIGARRPVGVLGAPRRRGLPDADQRAACGARRGSFHPGRG